MKNFYVFLDIDGVLYDWEYLISEIKNGRMKKGKLIRKFKPESMEALNLLLRKLEKNYNVSLVISSTWRRDMPFAIETLKANGLEYDKEFTRTPFSNPAQRGKQILEYLSDKENFDFLIIDDEMFDFKKFFCKDKIIKCDMFHSALSITMVSDFLSKVSKPGELVDRKKDNINNEDEMSCDK